MNRIIVCFVVLIKGKCLLYSVLLREAHNSTMTNGRNKKRAEIIASFIKAQTQNTKLILHSSFDKYPLEICQRSHGN